MLQLNCFAMLFAVKVLGDIPCKCSSDVMIIYLFNLFLQIRFAVTVLQLKYLEQVNKKKKKKIIELWAD